MEPSIGNRIELRQHQRQSVPGPCLLFLAVRLVDFIYRRCGGGGYGRQSLGQRMEVESEAACAVARPCHSSFCFPIKSSTTVDLAIVRWAEGDNSDWTLISGSFRGAENSETFLSRSSSVLVVPSEWNRACPEIARLIRSNSSLAL